MACIIINLSLFLSVTLTLNDCFSHTKTLTRSRCNYLYEGDTYLLDQCCCSVSVELLSIRICVDSHIIGSIPPLKLWNRARLRSTWIYYQPMKMNTRDNNKNLLLELDLIYNFISAVLVDKQFNWIGLFEIQWYERYFILLCMMYHDGNSYRFVLVFQVKFNSLHIFWFLGHGKAV